jgi:hypothetical protein
VIVEQAGGHLGSTRLWTQTNKASRAVVTASPSAGGKRGVVVWDDELISDLVRGGVEQGEQPEASCGAYELRRDEAR